MDPKEKRCCVPRFRTQARDQVTAPPGEPHSQGYQPLAGVVVLPMRKPKHKGRAGKDDEQCQLARGAGARVRGFAFAAGCGSISAGSYVKTEVDPGEARSQHPFPV